jgi:hypothetical protein
MATTYTMTLNQLRRILDCFLQETLSKLDFQRAESLIYSHPANEATALLAFPCRLDPRGPACFECRVWLRFQALEPFLQDEPRPTAPTVSMPLHLLRENKNFTEWQFCGLDDLEKMRSIILNDLREHALPFIEQYSKLAEVRAKLESPRRDWFILNPEQRLIVLAAIQFVQGDKLGALKTLDDALVERETAMPSKRLPIEAVRKRLVTSA